MLFLHGALNCVLFLMHYSFFIIWSCGKGNPMEKMFKTSADPRGRQGHNALAQFLYTVFGDKIIGWHSTCQIL